MGTGKDYRGKNDQLSNAVTAFIHEGAKAARAVRRMVEAQTPDAKKALSEHLWGRELKGGVHVGWIGGALSPHRTDWSPLRKFGVTHVVIVADNDAPGHAAVPKIAGELRAYPIHVEALRFDNRWPVGFDLADPFPESMFTEPRDEPRRYRGPSLAECLTPATWATRAVAPPPTTGPGRPPAPSYRLRSEFEEAAGAITINGVRSLNLWVPPRINHMPGEATPWLQFLEYLIPSADERGHVLRWLATLFARPGVRLAYGLLLASALQGVGKTTLCEVARRLVGERNTSNPTAQQMIESNFNSWIGTKRLIFVNEIYEGKGWTAYNKLKTYVTDATTRVNEKHMPEYTVPNWAHFILCSNSALALRLEEQDRRFLVPTVTELKQQPEFWRDFFAWLDSGGYGIIANWAYEFVAHYGAVEPGDNAPMTGRKRQLIEDSRSDEERMVLDLAAAALDRAQADGQPVVLVETEVAAWVRQRTGADVRPHILRGWLRGSGLSISARLKIAGSMKHASATMPIDGKGWGELRDIGVRPPIWTGCKRCEAPKAPKDRSILLYTQDIRERVFL